MNVMHYSYMGDPCHSYVGSASALPDLWPSCADRGSAFHSTQCHLAYRPRHLDYVYEMAN